MGLHIKRGVGKEKYGGKVEYVKVLQYIAPNGPSI
ncbi:uncharacterized protein G2W53_029250 [Senna tora]|uniref:Uncharacterized protein n=1 Tax=Senna tora TaxID=362788 RepID=A0A834T6V7_9FABA|nr:uncharacterized protein G2W53_029250 [Senna tora]